MMSPRAALAFRPSAFRHPLTATVVATLAAGGLSSLTLAGDGLQSAADARVAADVAKVNEAYIVAPKAAADLGCRIKWQTITNLPGNGTLKMVASSPVAVMALDNRNQLTLIRPETGDRAWMASAADPLDRVLGLGVFPFVTRGEADGIRIAVMADSVYYALGFDSGSTLDRSEYAHIPSTKPIQIGNWFVYGTSSGQVAYFNCVTGNHSRSHLVNAINGGHSVFAAPATGNGVVVAADSGGGVIGLHATSGSFMWKKGILAGVSASPAIGNSAAFVASEDQYIYAFDLASGATLWKYFTQTPLKSSPFVAGDMVLQNVPGEGLLALTQNPESQPGGEIRWRRASVSGKPIAANETTVTFWCMKGRVATVINLKDGATLRTISLPAVTVLEADSIEQGGFVAWSEDGRVERLSPMDASAAPSATAAK